jgi:hypothetical protein
MPGALRRYGVDEFALAVARPAFSSQGRRAGPTPAIVRDGAGPPEPVPPSRRPCCQFVWIDQRGGTNNHSMTGVKTVMLGGT